MPTKNTGNDAATTKPRTIGRRPDDFVDVATLSTLLHETEEHHGPYEASAPTHHWWDWYAPYLDARLRGSTSAEASNAAGRYMEALRPSPQQKL